ncbi:MAG: hypothetical protein KC731_15755, partial [Myxococcales bacterium]|nr:hypothetical protein [Myxococcales bacterium]
MWSFDIRRGLGLSVLAWLGVIAFSCAEELGEDYCENPGETAACECPDGRSSLRTCSAFNQLGECYCYRPGCGNGEVDDD